MAVIAKTPIIGNDGVIRIKSSGGAIVLTIPYSNADFKIDGLNAGVVAYSGTNKSMREVVDFFARGDYFGSRFAKGKILEFSFSGWLTALVGVTGDPSACDPVLMKADWAAATSTLPSTAGDVPHFTVEWAVERSNLGATSDNLLVLKYCELTIAWEEGEEGSKFTISGKAKPWSTDSFAVT